MVYDIEDAGNEDSKLIQSIVDIVIADLESKGDQSIIARRLRGR